MFNSNGDNLFQIYITEDDSLPIPEKILSCVSNVNEKKGHLEHYLLRNDNLIDILKQDFGLEVLKAYLKLKPFAFKADLARYCLTYQYGGWYFDISTKIREALPATTDYNYIVFREPPQQGSWFGVNNAVFYCKKSQSFLAKAIEKIIENCSKNYYGINPLDVTGPLVFGKMLTLYADLNEGLAGDYLSLTPHMSQKNTAFILPDGEIMAWGKITAGSNVGASLYALGGQGVNSYAHLWHAKDIYDLT
jgi:mannosyltransferase OCH1-like enzyme